MDNKFINNNLQQGQNVQPIDTIINNNEPLVPVIENVQNQEQLVQPVQQEQINPQINPTLDIDVLDVQPQQTLSGQQPVQSPVSIEPTVQPIEQAITQSEPVAQPISTPVMEVNNVKIENKSNEIPKEGFIQKEPEERTALDNSKNEIPLNPIAPPEKKKIDIDKVDYSLKDVIKMILKSFIKPGTILKENVEKYSSLRNSLLILLTISVIGIILAVISAGINACTVLNIDPLTGSYSTTFDTSKLMNVDVLAEIIKGLICSGGYILLVSIVYYGTSFFNNKGVRLGTYIMVNNIASIPIIFALNFFFPVGLLISGFVGASILIVLFIYTIVIFLIGTNEILTYKNLDHKIIYNIFNLSLISLIVILLLYLSITNGWYDLPFNISV